MQMTGQPHLASLTRVRAAPGRPVAARRQSQDRKNIDGHRADAQPGHVDRGAVFRPLGFDACQAGATRGGQRQVRAIGRGWTRLAGPASARGRVMESEFSGPLPGYAMPRPERHELGHGGDRARALAAAGRRIYSHGQEQAPGGGASRSGVADRPPAARRRHVHRSSRDRPICTATRSPRWRFAKVSASPATRSCKSRRSGRSSSSSTAQDPVGRRLAVPPGQEGDTSVFGWQIFALRSGNMAGIKIPKKVLEGLCRYLDSASDQKRVVYSYQPGRGASAVMTAEGLVSRQLLGWPRDFPALVKGVGQVSAHLQEGGDRNIYYWYYATQLLHNMRNEAVGALEPEDPRGADRAPGQGRHLRQG